MSSRKNAPGKKGNEPVKHIFKQDGADFKFLLRLFHNGTITDEQPAAVRAMHERFQKYSTNQFRSQFNKARGMAAGVALRGPQPPQDDDGPLPILPSFVPRNQVPVVAARPPAVAQLPSIADNDDEDDVTEEDGPTTWKPKRMVKEWENKHGIRHVTIIVWLSSGATEADIETMVSANGKKLTISEKWHQDLLDIGEFYYLYQQHTKENLEDTNVRRHAMQQYVRSILDVRGDVISEFTMELPFPVDPSTLNVTFPSFESGALFCHVDLAEKRKKRVAQSFVMRKRHAKGKKKGDIEYNNLTPHH
ncbi:hypothetical protein SEMRO_411_G137520.1 [Seminavis robusta]|uniref:Uncharacterized protein n=1 Tax=Seminavis robusta TaxID=568900 RepID=A0A9N8DZD2_9STRA|nr:hypothetical protein SEMRO_411_G137520.1 [Seminavis robusta]|eukprot:Sro411_g137520.1 n/a (305) ;mRNA; r:1891-2805